MEYSALTIGLTDELFSNIQTLLTSNLRFTPSLTVQDASRLLIQQVFHLLVVDLEYLRSILQVDWLPSVRRVTFVPIVVLSDTPERDLHSLIHHGVDICISSKQAPFLIADIILPSCGVTQSTIISTIQKTQKQLLPSRRHFY